MIALRSIRRAAEVRQFIKFLIVGGLNTLVGYAIFSAFILGGTESAMAVIATTIIGALFNFASTGWIVFRSSETTLLPRFMIVYAGQGVVNIAMLRALETIGLAPLVAQALLLPLITILSFAAMRQFVFNGNKT
jgi:putative flippase GtrA